MSEPTMYRKTALVEAHQWRQNGDHPRDGDSSTEGDLVRYFRRPEPQYAGQTVHEACGYTWHRHGWIDDLEGGHVVCPKDWILTGPGGESWAVKPDIFAATYELSS